MAALKGPEYFLKATELHQKIRHEQNQTKRMEMIAEAQLNATLALIALQVETSLDDKRVRPWINHGFRKFD